MTPSRTPVAVFEWTASARPAGWTARTTTRPAGAAGRPPFFVPPDAASASPRRARGRASDAPGSARWAAGAGPGRARQLPGPAGPPPPRWSAIPGSFRRLPPRWKFCVRRFF